jgi:hypothetical protein
MFEETKVTICGRDSSESVERNVKPRVCDKNTCRMSYSVTDQRKLKLIKYNTVTSEIAELNLLVSMRISAY